MISRKLFWHDVKLFLRIFFILFIIIFFIFDGTAFGAIVAYKVSYWFDLVKTNIVEPPHLGSITIETSSLNIISTNTTKTNIVVPAVPAAAQNNNLLELPKFNITTPIWVVNTPDLELIYKKLKEGVVLYPGTAIPGEGYSIILGHSSQYPWQPGRYKSVFSLLSQLEIGDKIYIYWNQKPLVFEVSDKKIFLPWPKGNDTTETVFPPENQPILILQSCWPVGVAYKRVAVKTVLISQ